MRPTNVCGGCGCENMYVEPEIKFRCWGCRNGA